MCMGRFHSLSGIVRLSWKALDGIIRDNRANENYLSSKGGWINPGMVSQMPFPLGAASCFSTLITNNADLLENVIDKTMLLAFEDLILQHGPQARLMGFFTAICSCLGSPILSNQEVVLSHLVLDNVRSSKMLLTIREDTDTEGLAYNTKTTGLGQVLVRRVERASMSKRA